MVRWDGATEYNKDMDMIALEALREGKTLCQVAALLGVCRETVHRWRNPDDERRYQESFKEATDLGLTYAQAHWENVGVEATEKKIFNTDIWKFFMKNRFKKDYQESKQIVGDPDNPICGLKKH